MKLISFIETLFLVVHGRGTCIENTGQMNVGKQQVNVHATNVEDG